MRNLGESSRAEKIDENNAIDGKQDDAICQRQDAVPVVI